MNFQLIKVQGQCGEQSTSKASGLCRYNVVVHVREMQSAQNRKQKKQQRGDTRKPKQIEAVQGNLRQRTPAPDSDRGEEKPGAGKTHVHPELGIPNEMRPNL